MLKNQLIGHITISDAQLSWREAIRASAQDLLNHQFITEQYIQDVISNVEQNGAYIVLVPHIALPHARSNGNVLKTGISCLKLTNATMFPDNQPVSLLFFLATNDDSHLDMLADFADILSEDEKIDALKQAQTEEQILAVFN